MYVSIKIYFQGTGGEFPMHISEYLHAYLAPDARMLGLFRLDVTMTEKMTTAGRPDLQFSVLYEAWR
jgi:hypothetical protein